MSCDGGETWDSTYFDQTLIGPVCQDSIIDFQLPDGQQAIQLGCPTPKIEEISVLYTEAISKLYHVILDRNNHGLLEATFTEKDEK